MPEYRKYYNKREIIKLDLVQNEDYTDNVILCVPKFAYDVARSMLAHYGKFRTSYAVSYGEQHYEIPSDAAFDDIEASIDLFLGSRDMSCDIVEALECICDQFALQVAATNELVAATYTSSVNANYAGSIEQTAGEEGGSIPVGASAPDTGITDRKCKAAHFIVDNVNLMVFDLLTSSPPPWYSIGEVAAYLEEIGANHGFANMLAEIYNGYSIFASFVFGATIDYEAIYDDIVLNYDAIVCALFNATSATDARTDFLAELTVTGDEYSFVAELLYNNILNLLWFAVADSETRLAGWPTTVDCATCDTGFCVAHTLGTGDDIVKGVECTITAVWVAGPNKYYIQVGQECDCVDYTVTITGCNRSSGWTGGAVANCAVENQWYWTSQTNPNGVYTAAALQSFSSSGTFYLTVKFEDV